MKRDTPGTATRLVHLVRHAMDIIRDLAHRKGTCEVLPIHHRVISWTGLDQKPKDLPRLVAFSRRDPHDVILISASYTINWCCLYFDGNQIVSLPRSLELIPTALSSCVR